MKPPNHYLTKYSIVGVVIYFPRPKMLERMSGQKPYLIHENRLHRENFDAWTQREKVLSQGKQITDFKTLVEKINDNLVMLDEHWVIVFGNRLNTIWLIIQK